MTKDTEEKQELSEEETPESPAQEEKDTPEEKTKEPSMEKVEESPKVDRLPRTIEETVPKGRFNKERDKVKTLQQEKEDLQSQIKDLSFKAATGNLDIEVKQIAEDAGVDSEVLRKLSLAITKNVNVSPEVKQEIEEIKEKISLQNQESGFEQEYNQFIKNHPSAAAPEVRAKLKELAFTEEFAKAPLSVIFHGHPGEFAPDPSKKSAETSRGGTSVPGGQDWRIMSNQEISDLPGDEKGKIYSEMSEQDPKRFDEYSDWEDSQSKSIITRK